MVSLIVAAACFLGIHIFVSGTRLRDVIVGRIGERSYLAIFSLGSLGIIIWMSGAYGAAPYLKLWSAGAASRHIAFALMLPAVFLVVTGLATRNPTATGGAPLLERERAAVGIMTVTRHPFMWGIVIWSLAHLLANGDIASLIFFGSFGAVALIGPHLIDAKLAKRKGEAWAKYAAETSWLPFQAIVQRRNTLRLREIGWWRLALALVVYAVLLVLVHDWLIGMPLIDL